MIRVSQLKIAVGHTPDQLREKIIRFLHIAPEELKSCTIRRQSLDAREKPDLYYVYTVDVCVKNEERTLRAAAASAGKNAHGKRGGKSAGRNAGGAAQAARVQETRYRCPEPGEKPLHSRPVVVGSGPAGLFCAWLLAENGYAPIVLERGAPVSERKKDVEAFWKTGILNTESNVQFGEGGAGTFSDGKLNTLVKDKSGRNHLVLETFVRFGAPEDILYSYKPHIGTDVLIGVVENMREEIIRLGGEVHFHTCLTAVGREKQVASAVGPGGAAEFPAEVLVLALGHSARDTFAMLNRQHISMEAKSFAVGVRIEHPQEMIDRAQYGRARGDILPPASYKLAENNVGRAGRNVYTFCMCPGGYVVNASSEAGRLAVNGMSYRGRDGRNANSAVIATVTPADFGQTHPLAGVEFQRKLEQKAFLAAAGKIPVQRFVDFQKNVPTIAFGRIRPAAKGEAAPANVRGIFTPDLAESLEEGILRMDRKIAGFAGDDVLLSGVESRTSSPVRILRTDEMVSPDAPWIYPCGEGAGYAGGITSAAMDGIRTAEAIIRRFRPITDT